jgi:hypothetical protein
MASDRTASSGQETAVGLVILLALVGIATWVLVAQSRFDPAIISPVALKEGTAPVSRSTDPGSSALQEFIAEGMRPLSPIESFGPETLSEKIDGKAELYLSAGFLQLHCQRFVKAGEAASWMEVFVYDMGNLRSAFSVYSSQRRADARDAPFARFAYQSQNALFFIHGQYYVEIVASAETMLPEMLAFGQRFISVKPAETGGEVSEVSLFPPTGLNEGSVSLLSSDVFGFEGLDQVFVASYTLDRVQMTAFVSLRKDEEEAATLASSYHRFLLRNGGVEEEAAGSIPGLKVVSLLDTFELVFVRGRYLAGIHEADNREIALRLAIELDKALQGVSP